MNPSEGATNNNWRGFCDELFAQSKFGIELGLEPMREALAAEGHPERSSRAVLVAGTNGKGGTAAFIAGILQAHGHRTGLYTSPHLIDLRERFRVDGRPLDIDRVLPVGRDLLERFGEETSEGPRLTFFELTTLMAARLFDQCGVDVAVYEVGLGGRLDAVNAIEPDLSVITNVERDHTEYLGDEIADIAREKCGILRQDVPAVVGHQRHVEALEAIESAVDASERRIYGRDFDLERVVDAFVESAVPETTLLNASAAYEATQLLIGTQFSEVTALEGLSRTRWPGRFDRRTVASDTFGTERSVEILFDSAHNPSAVEILFEQLGDWRSRISAVVCGGMADKELAEMFGHLRGGPPVWGAVMESDRSASPEELAEAIPSDCLTTTSSTRESLSQAVREAAEEGGEVLVFGSTYLVGECFDVLGIAPETLVTYS